MKSKKRFAALLLACTIAVGLSGAALADMPEQRQASQTAAYATKTSGKCGKNLKWKLSSDGTLTISGTGAMKNYDYEKDPSPWKGNASIQKVVIKKGVTSIGAQAFFWCDNLTSVSIPSTVKSIGMWAFWDSGLTSVTIPKNVTKIGEAAFQGCDGLKKITVSSSNKKYSSKAGVLFNKKKTELLQYPGGKTGSYAVPGSVKSIGKEAFSYNKNLTAITIPTSVTEIKAYAFYQCDQLKAVRYQGSKSKWKKIKIRSGNGDLKSAKITYR